MRDKTTYEWIVEQINEDDDIIDTCAYNTFLEAKRQSEYTPEEGCHYEIGLTRNMGNDAEGLTDRLWAYIKNGKLPEYFQTAYGTNAEKVPQRFFKEMGYQSIKRHEIAPVIETVEVKI